MSPEQTQSTHDLTPATDIYSLGVIFYELLEGRLPFYSELPIDILRMHTSEPPPPIRRPDVPPAVQAIVMQMLAKDPKDRPVSGAKVIELLDAIPQHELSTKRAPIRASGEARSSDPTLLSAPEDRAPTSPDSFGGAHLHPTLDDLEPGERSVILDLTDIVPDDLIGDGVTARDLQPTEISAHINTGPAAGLETSIPTTRGTLYETMPPQDDDQLFASINRSSQTRNRLVLFFMLLIGTTLAIALYLLSQDDTSPALDSSGGEQIADINRGAPAPSQPQLPPERREPPAPQPRGIRVGDSDFAPTPTENSAGGTQPSTEQESPNLAYPPAPPPTRPATTQRSRSTSQARPTRSRNHAPSPTQRSDSPSNADEAPEEQPRRPARLDL